MRHLPLPILFALAGTLILGSPFVPSVRASLGVMLVAQLLGYAVLSLAQQRLDDAATNAAV